MVIQVHEEYSEIRDKRVDLRCIALASAGASEKVKAPPTVVDVGRCQSVRLEYSFRETRSFAQREPL